MEVEGRRKCVRDSRTDAARVGRDPRLRQGRVLDLVSYSKIQVAHDGSTAYITLKNSPVNVIDIPMMEDLLAAIKEIEQQPEITTIVFRGEGKCFSAGVDIAAHTP